jgi:hypothetical protein
MFEAHGWVTVRATEDDATTDQRHDRELEAQVIELAAIANVVVRFDAGLNGSDVLTLAAYKNHRVQAVFDLFEWIAANRPWSYGLLYVRDAEDVRGFDNAFRAWRIARGVFAELDDPFLSPVVPTIEAPYAPDEE